MKKKKKRRLTSLFFRILGGIIIPLLILMGAFAGLVLRRELAMQRRYSMQEARLDLGELSQKFQELLAADMNLLDFRTKLAGEMKKLEKALEVRKIDIYDPASQASILSSYPLENVLPDAEMLNVQQALAMRREGKSYYFVIDEKKHELLGYLPIRDKDRSRVLVVSVHSNLMSIKEALGETFATLGMTAGAMVAAAFFIAFVLTVRIVRPIRAINRACREMLSGNLGLQVKVQTGDELELMASNFNRMSQALLQIARTAEDANPLTQLPGNREIMKDLDRRIEGQEKFVFFHIDIDHFKAYNDHYGLARGDEVLKRTGELLAEAIKEIEPNGTFLGHQGGDDFVMMTDPVNAPKIGERFCKKFDDALKEFYNKEDLERGYFMEVDSRSTSLTEDTELKRQPLMSITLAGISNIKNVFSSYDEVMERAAKVKKKGKKIPYSKFLIEE